MWLVSGDGLELAGELVKLEDNLAAADRSEPGQRAVWEHVQQVSPN